MGIDDVDKQMKELIGKAEHGGSTVRLEPEMKASQQREHDEYERKVIRSLAEQFKLDDEKKAKLQFNSDEKKKAKLEYHRLPPEQLAGMAKIMNDGAATHPIVYMELDPLLYWNATMRHLMAIRRGELIDPDDGMSHMLHIACNGMILDRMLEAGKKLVFEVPQS